MLFRILWAIDALVAAVFVVFFFIGIADGSVSSFNIGLWVVILGGLAGVLWGSIALRKAGKPGPATALVAVLAVPGVLAGLFLVLVLVLQPRWN